MMYIVLRNSTLVMRSFAVNYVMPPLLERQDLFVVFSSPTVDEQNCRTTTYLSHRWLQHAMSQRHAWFRSPQKSTINPQRKPTLAKNRQYNTFTSPHRLCMCTNRHQSTTASNRLRTGFSRLPLSFFPGDLMTYGKWAEHPLTYWPRAHAMARKGPSDSNVSFQTRNAIWASSDAYSPSCREYTGPPATFSVFLP